VARRASNAERAPGKRSDQILRGLRIAFNLCVLTCALVGCVWAAVRVEHFVLNDRQFLLQGPPEPGVGNGSFRIVGLKHAPEQRVIDVFARDFGRSTYLCPIQERRRRLLAIDWIKEASVTRIWPNQIIVHVTERKPVAFAQTPGLDGGAMFFKLVDAEGVLLDPRHAGQLALPVLAGFPAGGTAEVRLARMKRFLRLQSELGALMDNISEIDVSDPDNLKITQDFEGRAFTLMVGSQNYLERYRNFVDNVAEIRSRLPNAAVFDLRLKDRITAVGVPQRREREASR
jgi:cell division protein FtsQ